MKNNIMLLLKIQILYLFGINKAIKTNDKKEKLKLWSLIIVFVFSGIMLLGVSFMYSYNMSTAFEMFGMMELLPVIMMVATCLTTIFTTIYKSSGILFGFRDYDLLMALPVKTSDIIGSRIIMINIINIFFTLIIMIPAGIVYSIKTSPEFSFYVFYIITLCFIPLVPIILASIVGYIISFVSSKFKHTNLVNLILSMALIIGIMAMSYYSNSNEFDLINIKSIVMTKLKLYYPLATFYHDAVINYNIVSFFLFITISTGIFIFFVLIIAYKFKSINSSLSSSNIDSNYKMIELKKSPQFIALYKKEMKRYFSSTIYVLNTAFGVVFMTFISIGILVFGIDKMGSLLEIPNLNDMINKFAPIVLSIFTVSSCTSCCSISLEGKNVWLPKTLPINVLKIFLSKIAVNLTVLIPPIIINSILLSSVLRFNIVETFFMLIVPINYAFFISISGLAINLNLPNLQWISEVTVIKQSASVLVTMIFGLLSIAIPIVLILKLPEINAYLIIICTTFIIALINLILYKYLSTVGVKKFNKL